MDNNTELFYNYFETAIKSEHTFDFIDLYNSHLVTYLKKYYRPTHSNKGTFYPKYNPECKCDKLHYFCKILSFCDKSGNNFLMWLMDNYEYDTVIMMIINFFGKYCNLEQVNVFGETALIKLCKHNQEKSDCYEKMFGKPLPLYIDEKVSKICEALIVHDDLCLPMQIDNGDYTALMWACKGNLQDTACEILKKFGDKCLPQYVNKNGESALSFAKLNSMMGVIELLEKDE